jgi:hypothetical protein
LCCLAVCCSQVKTINDCGCSNTWDFGGTRYSGTCRTGLTGTTTVPGISQDTNWCYVDKGCAKGKRVDGFMFDVCTPAGGRVTEDGAACQFPATYHGISLYNCISYNHSAPGAETLKPWCFTNAATGAWGYCAPWTCTAALKANCPAGNPADNPAAWATSSCLATLCNARRDLANVSMCTQDTEGDRTLLTTAYSTLAANTVFGQQPLLTGTGKNFMLLTSKLQSSCHAMAVPYQHVHVVRMQQLAEDLCCHSTSAGSVSLLIMDCCDKRK